MTRQWSCSIVRGRSWWWLLPIALVFAVCQDALESARVARWFSGPAVAVRLPAPENAVQGGGSPAASGTVVLRPSSGRRSLTSAVLEWNAGPAVYHHVSLRVRGGTLSLERVPRLALRPPESRLLQADDRVVGIVLGPRARASTARIALTNLSRRELVVESLEIRRVGVAYTALRILVALALLAAITLAISSLPAIAWRRAALAFVAAFLLYRLAWVPDLDNGNDNFWYVPSAQSLLRDGDVELSEFDGVVWQFQPSYRLVEVGERWYNLFPIGVPVAIAPFVPYAGWQASAQIDTASRWLASAAWLADLFAALAVALLYPLALRLGADPRIAAVVTAGFALATPHFAIHAGGLWSHCVSATLLVAAALVVETGASRWSAGLAGALAGLAVLARPTALVVVVCVTLAAALRHRGRAAALVLGLVPVGLGFSLWSLRTFGAWLPPYGRKNTALLSPEDAAEGLAGVWLSPNRGLLVFCPLVLLSLLGAVVAVTDSRFRSGPLVLLGPGCVIYGAIVGAYEVWWGGGSYGPRLLAEVLPFLALLWIPALDRLRCAWPRYARPVRVGLVATASLLAGWSLFAAWQGAFEPATREWNSGPGNVLRGDTSRLWDWGDLQILRGLGPTPAPLRQRRGRDDPRDEARLRARPFNAARAKAAQPRLARIRPVPYCAPPLPTVASSTAAGAATGSRNGIEKPG